MGLTVNRQMSEVTTLPPPPHRDLRLPRKSHDRIVSCFIIFTQQRFFS